MIKKTLLLIIAATLLVSLSGCMTVRVADRGSDANFATPPTYSAFQHHFLWALINAGQPRTAEEVCGGSGNAIKVEHRYHFGHMILTGITAGIWVPSTLKVWCR